MYFRVWTLLPRPGNIWFVQRCENPLLLKGTSPMTVSLKFLSFVLLSSAVVNITAQAATYTAASCNTSDVQATINKASDGDVVIIPNGSCSWTNGISVSKQLT